MPTYPLVQITDAPTLTAAVLYDFTDASLANVTMAVLADGWSLGTPAIDGDPDAVGVEYGLRTMALTNAITGTKAAALLRHGALAKALLRSRFWVRFQLDATRPSVWFRGYRSQPGDMSFDQVYVDSDTPNRSDRWAVGVSIFAEPFAYSARVAQASVTVGNNPANSAPASGFTLPTIRGDAPARLRVKVTPSTGATVGQRWLVTAIASNRAAPVLRSPIGGTDGLTAGAGVSASTANTDAVGGTVRTVSFADTVLTLRLTGDFPNAGAPAGRYLVLLRVAATSTAGATLAFQLRDGQSTAISLAPVVSVTFPEVTTAVDNYQWVPLGVIGVGDTLPADVTPPTKRNVGLWVGASDTSATARLDDFLLIPVSGPGVDSTVVLDAANSRNSATSTLPQFFDGDDEVSWVDGLQDGTYRISHAGGFPQVDPASANNTLLVMALSHSGQAGDLSASRATGLAATAAVVVSYLPRSTWIGDGT